MASENELKWLELVVSGTPHKEATQACFDINTPSSLVSKTSQLKGKFVDEVNAALMKEMKQLAPTAFKNIIDLAKNCELEAVKLKACQDVLDRSGFKPSLQVEDITNREPQTEQEAINELAEAIKSLESEGIPIGSIIDMPVIHQELDS